MDYEDEVPDKKRSLVLATQSVVVEKVNISGLKKTKRDYVLDELKSVFDTKTINETYKESLHVRQKLLSKGIFKNVEVILDTTSHYDNHTKNGIQVLFRCTEKSTITGEVKTELSNQDHPRWIMRILSPNVAGRAESINLSLSRRLDSGTGSLHTPTDFSVNFVKPYKNTSSIRVSLLNQKTDSMWNSTALTTRGFEFEYKLPDFGSFHSTIGWNGYWREMSALNKSASFYVRENLGHTLKSSLLHSISLNQTDSKIFPSMGYSVKIEEELAGIGVGNKFLKENLEIGFHKTLNNVTLSATGNAGFIYNIDHKDVHLQDRFYVGGPLTLRGFELNSVGCKNECDYVGGSTYWVAGLHAYTPLPFCWKNFGSGSWLDNFRVHLFINGGNLLPTLVTNVKDIRNLVKDSKSCCGFGIAYNLMGLARIEFNYCVPLKAGEADKVTDGFQFGIGMSFV